MALEVLLEIGNVPIFSGLEGGYVCFTSDLDVCTDGTGGRHGDKTHLSRTAYSNHGHYLNADEDQYIVIPPQIRSMVAPVVMGCQARATNLLTAKWSAGVTGEIGPKAKTGEAAYCLAKILNPDVTANSGDSRPIYFYELWPGIPAVVGTKTYKLEPA